MYQWFHRQVHQWLSTILCQWLSTILHQWLLPMIPMMSCDKFTNDYTSYFYQRFIIIVLPTVLDFSFSNDFACFQRNLLFPKLTCLDFLTVGQNVTALVYRPKNLCELARWIKIVGMTHLYNSNDIWVFQRFFRC